jgi:hypothetical protein
MCPVRDGDPANCGGDKGTDVLFFCRSRLAEFEIRHLNDFRFSGKCSWTFRHPQDLPPAPDQAAMEAQLRVQSKALSGRLATIALELSPDASSIGHRSTTSGFSVCWLPVKVCASPNQGATAFASTRPPSPPMERGSAPEVLKLRSGDFVFEGNASVRFGVGDAPRSVKKDLQAIALSQEHRLTHLLRNPWCRNCQRAERATQPAGNATKAVLAEIRVFSDLVAVGHLGAQEQCRCRYRYESSGMIRFGRAMTKVENTLPAGNSRSKPRWSWRSSSAGTYDHGASVIMRLNSLVTCMLAVIRQSFAWGVR